MAFRRMILSVPPGKVSTYGAIAAAAGYPRYHRAVARLLRTDPVDQLPWHRVVGAGGAIKLLHLTSRVRDLLQITKLTTLSETFDDEAEVLRSFS